MRKNGHEGGRKLHVSQEFCHVGCFFLSLISRSIPSSPSFFFFAPRRNEKSRDAMGVTLSLYSVFFLSSKWYLTTFSLPLHLSSSLPDSLSFPGKEEKECKWENSKGLGKHFLRDCFLLKCTWCKMKHTFHVEKEKEVPKKDLEIEWHK